MDFLLKIANEEFINDEKGVLEGYRKILNIDSLDLAEKCVVGMSIRRVIALCPFPFYRRDFCQFSLLRELLINLSEEELKQFSEWEPEILMNENPHAHKFFRFLHYEFNDIYELLHRNPGQEWLEEMVDNFQESLSSCETPQVGTQEWKEFLISLLECILQPLWERLLNDAQEYDKMKNGLPFLVTKELSPYIKRIIQVVCSDADAETIRKSDWSISGIRVFRRSLGL